MRLAETNYDNSETGCCARLDEGRWDNRELTWNERPFLKDHIRAFLRIPLNFGSVVSRVHKAIEDAEAYPVDPIWLTDEVSPWGSDVLVALEREVPGVEIEELPGTFLTRVFEGPYRMVGKWTAEMEDYVRSKGREPRKIYAYYATCPSCSTRTCSGISTPS